MALIDDLQVRQQILLKQIEDVKGRADLRGKQKGLIQESYAREYKQLSLQIQRERLRQDVASGKTTAAQAERFLEVQQSNLRADAMQRQSTTGARLSSLPGSIQSPQAQAYQRDADAAKRRAAQERGSGNQDEAARYEQQSAEAQKKALAEQKRFNVASQEPSQRERIFGRPTATQEIGRPAVGIPFQTRGGITESILGGRGELAPVIAISPALAGKAATVEGVQVSTGQVTTLSAPSNVITPPEPTKPAIISIPKTEFEIIKTVIPTAFNLKESKIPLFTPAQYLIEPVKNIIAYLSPKAQANIQRASIATLAVTAAVVAAVPVIAVTGTGFVATTVVSLGTGLFAEEVTKKASEKLTLTPEQRELAKTPEYKEVREAAEAQVRSPSKIKEFFIQNIPFLSLTREKKLRAAAETEALKLNITEEKAGKIAELVIEKKEIGEFASTAGLLPVGAASELYGSVAITKEAIKSFGEKVLKQDILTAFKTSAKISAEPLAKAGAQEGAVSYITTQRAEERPITPLGIVESAAIGAVSALTLGVTIIGGKLLTKAKGVKAASARAFGKTADISGNILDITEKPSDILADIAYPVTTPNIFIRPTVKTFSFAPTTPSEITPSKVQPDIKTSAPSKALIDVRLNVPVNVKTPINIQAKTRTGAPVRTPANIPVRTPAEVPVSVPVDIPIKTPSKVPAIVPGKVPSLVPARTPAEVPVQVPLDVPILTKGGLPFPRGASGGYDIPKGRYGYGGLRINPLKTPKQFFAKITGVTIKSKPQRSILTIKRQTLYGFNKKRSVGVI